MDTQYIREFAVLAECQSFSKAAEQLYLAQPTLSKHIQALENSLGCRLFVRTTRKMELTEAGGIFLGYARQIASLASAGENAVQAAQKKHLKSLTLGIQTPEYFDLIYYLKNFREEYPYITVNIIESDDAGLREMFFHHQLNLFTAIMPPADKNSYCFLPLRKTRFYAILRKDHRLASGPYVSLSDLASERLMLPARGSAQSQLILAALKDSGVTPDISYEGTSERSADILKHCMDVSLHSAEFASDFSDDPDVCIRPVEPEVSFTYGLGYRDLEELSVAESRYLAFCRELTAENTAKRKL